MKVHQKSTFSKRRKKKLIRLPKRQYPTGYKLHQKEPAKKEQTNPDGIQVIEVAKKIGEPVTTAEMATTTIIGEPANSAVSTPGKTTAAVRIAATTTATTLATPAVGMQK